MFYLNLRVVLWANLRILKTGYDHASLKDGFWGAGRGVKDRGKQWGQLAGWGRGWFWRRVGRVRQGVSSELCMVWGNVCGTARFGGHLGGWEKARVGMERQGWGNSMVLGAGKSRKKGKAKDKV